MTRRVVSLLPSTTEIVAALGRSELLVGRSHECDFPAEVEDLPVISRPRHDPVGSSAQIHRGVQELLTQVLSIYQVDADALREAAPDLILTQDLCRVCAVAEDEVLAAARAHLGHEVEVLTSSPLTLAGVLGDILRVAEALGAREEGEALVARLRGEFAAIHRAVSGRTRPTLTLLEWVDPLMAGGTWGPELIELAGATPLLGAAGGHSPLLAAEELARADPDVLVVSPCGYGLDRAAEDLPLLRALPGWEQLTAVRSGRVAVVDGSAYVNRPGPRLVETAAILAAVVHGVGPGCDLEGTGWRWMG
ncbi:MAG: cobalamin-binding protein [Nitriliruptor sp.]|nr:MAG: cobalamin-binding protein [Nitriliruptor sp.]